MTTRAGFVGLLTGLAATLVLFFTTRWTTNFTPPSWATIIAALILTIGGALAARWSGSSNPLRSATLGGLAGGLAGTLVFCLFGAAAAGLNSAKIAASVIRQTELAFLICFFVGIFFGGLGGWLTHPRRNNSAEYFDKSAPQMALNVAITAVPASIVARVAAAAAFSVSDFPFIVSLLLVLTSQLALTLVVPHEAREAEHLCSMDEVKMAAYVAIGAFPLLAALLLLVNAALFTKLPIIIVLLTSAGLSLKSLQTLRKTILPLRATFPIQQDEQQKLEAKLFGTIASSRGPRLVVLCIGCGLVMILPLHVVLISVLINLNILMLNPAHFEPVQIAPKLFQTQALVSSGLMAASSAILSIIYLFYLNLGRWFNRRISSSPRPTTSKGDRESAAADQHSGKHR